MRGIELCNAEREKPVEVYILKFDGGFEEKEFK
jgi:hypothetical protein